MPPSPSQVRLRPHDFETAECEYCRWYVKGNCRVLAQNVDPEQVCDAYGGTSAKSKKFKVFPGELKAFAVGMKKVQPYKHFVTGLIETPVGPILLIRDSMRPKPHRFGLDMKFSNAHLANEHHWTQKEVDRLIRLGGKNER